MVRSELLEKLLLAHPHLPWQVVEAALDTILNEITAPSGARPRKHRWRAFAFSFPRAMAGHVSMICIS